MTVERVIVLISGLGLIVFIFWYFFMKKEKKVKAKETIDVLVKGGYQPSVISVRQGIKTKINFKRVDENRCLEEVNFPDFRMRRFLPLNKTVTIEISPEKKGVYRFSCGMGMFTGRLIVE